MFKVWAKRIVKPINDDHSDSEVSLPGLERENSFIYMNESLTSMNRMLLIETRIKNMNFLNIQLMVKLE